MTLIVPELARAWQEYFREKGGMSPNIPPEVVPVVIMDDNSKGPYPPCRHWQYGNTLAASVGNFSVLGIKNKDPLGMLSVCVVDSVQVGSIPAFATDWRIGIIPISLFGLTDDPSRDVIVEKDPSSVLGADPMFANVVGGATANATINTLINSIVPGGPSGTVTLIKGPFIFGPQQILAVFSQTAQNLGITAYFRGRYYSAL